MSQHTCMQNCTPDSACFAQASDTAVQACHKQYVQLEGKDPLTVIELTCL